MKNRSYIKWQEGYCKWQPVRVSQILNTWEKQQQMMTCIIYLFIYYFCYSHQKKVFLKSHLQNFFFTKKEKMNQKIDKGRNDSNRNQKCK